MSTQDPFRYKITISDVSTVIPLQMTLQGVRFQRCKCAFGPSKESEPMPSASGMSEIAACPPSPTAADPSVRPPPTSPPSSCSNSSFLFTKCQPLYASCTVPLNFLRCCSVRLKMLSLFFGCFFNALFVWKVL